MNDANTICKNCSHEFEGKYCPSCGQKGKTGRITIRQVFKDIRNHFIHFEQGFLYTIKELLIRPGHTIREYIEGKRVRHIKPVRFMFWATAISFLVLHYLGFEEKLLQQIQARQGNPTNLPQQQHFAQKLSEMIMGHPSILMLSLLPGIGLCSWLLFRKRGYNYAEHFTIGAFLMGELSLFSVLTNLIFMYGAKFEITQMAVIGSLQWLVWAAYFAWAYRQISPEGKKVVTWIKGIGVLFLGYFVMIVVTMLGIATALTLFKPQIETWMNQ
jgi:hypothetical protein